MQPNYDTYIAPGSYNQKQGPDKKLIFIIGGLVLAVVIAVVLMIFSGGDTTASLGQRLQARLNATYALTEDGADNLTDDHLRTINAEARLILESDLASLNAALGLADSQPSEQLLAEESEQALLDELTDAKLQNNYNQEFKKAFSQKLESSAALASEIYNKSNDETVRSTMSDIFDHLSTLQDRLANT